MKIYVASSWKNQHAVEMLTEKLRTAGHSVASFVENNFDEDHGPDQPMDFERWVTTPKAYDAFLYDTQGATRSDLVIYIGPSGCDAWAEVGAAWASGTEILGLWAKGEQIGLMRHMVAWHRRVPELLQCVEELSNG